MVAPTRTPEPRVMPVSDNPALQRAHVHDVFVNGRRIGGVCFVRGAWRVLAFTQAAFASRDDAVQALIERRGRSQ